MGVDIEIGLDSLTNIIFQQAQLKLNTTCLPPLGSNFMDSINIKSISSQVNQTNIEFNLSLELLIVNEADLRANLDPDQTVESAQMVLELGIDETSLFVTVMSITAPTPATQLIADQVASQLGVLSSVDLSQAFFAIGLGTPTESRFAQIGNTIAIHFDPTDPVVDHLASTSYQWCLFVSADTMEQQVIDLITMPGSKPLLAQKLSPDPATAKWAPKAGQGHIDASLTGSGNRVCAEIHAYESFHIDFYVPSRTVVPQLVKVINFDVYVQSDNVISPFGLQHYLNEQAAQAVANFDPATLGGVRLGDAGTSFGEHNFSVTTDLFPSDPTTGAPGRLQLGSTTLNLAASAGLADGLALGGSVTLGPPVDIIPLAFSVAQFPNTFTQYIFCSPGATGRPTVLAVADLSRTGHLCDVTVLSPTKPDVTQFMTITPSTGSDTDTVSISILMTDLATVPFAATNQSIVIRVRTTRGVRDISFGTPPAPEYTLEGTLLNVKQIYVGNCPQVSPTSGGPSGWRFGVKGHGWLINPPPAWWDNLEQTSAFQISLVTVKQADAVVFKQPTDGRDTLLHAHAGTIKLPIAVALRNHDEGTVLEAFDKKELRNVHVQSKLFRRAVTLHRPGAIEHQLVSTRASARVVTRFPRRIEISEVDRLGTSSVIESMDEGSEQYHFTQKLLQYRNQGPSTEEAGLPDSKAIHTIPGFEDSGVAIAELNDGALRVLQKDKEADAKGWKVTGVMPRWLKGMEVMGQWAISGTKGACIAVFQVDDSTARSSNGGEGCRCECSAE